MIVKKLLARFINDKVLQNAEHCYIATAAISEAGFDLFMSKLSAKCTVEIITGLDLPTSPNVLRKVLGQFNDRVTLKIYTKNFFHPKVYGFNLPYRKQVAYVGSGNFTKGGFADNEELSYQLTLEKEIEEIKSWFNKYSDSSIELTDSIINRYELIYHSEKERQNESRQEKQQFIDLISGNFNLENIDFSQQYFTKEDYLTFDNAKANLNTQDVRSERVRVQNKLLDLHDELKSYSVKKKIFPHYDSNHIISSLDPMYHHEHKVRGMWLAYGRSESELNEYNAKHMDLIRLQIIIRQQDFGIWLMPGKQNSGKEDRDYFRDQMRAPSFRIKFYDLLKKLGDDYWIEIIGEKRKVSDFKDEDELWQFTQSDNLQYYFTIGKTYPPDNPEISSTKITSTIISEFDKLFPLYRLMKDKSFEK